MAVKRLPSTFVSFPASACCYVYKKTGSAAVLCILFPADDKNTTPRHNRHSKSQERQNKKKCGRREIYTIE